MLIKWSLLLFLIRMMLVKVLMIFTMHYHRYFFHCLEDTYVGRRRLQGRSRPMFEIDFWNMHQRTTDVLMRTNNSFEAWHRRLSSITQCEHPNLCKFIECLQNEEHFIHYQLIKIHSGEKAEPNKKCLNYSIRLRNLIMNPQPTILQQLESLARNS